MYQNPTDDDIERRYSMKLVQQGDILVKEKLLHLSKKFKELVRDVIRQCPENCKEVSLAIDQLDVAFILVEQAIIRG